MKTIKLLSRLLFLSIFLTGSMAFAHCEIPCGIYDDTLRLNLLGEHITTIEKSTNKIIELQNIDPANPNQLTRWVLNKETHATAMQEIISQYFLTQRIKPTQPQYKDKLVVLHKMLIAAMKTKQSVDLKHVKELTKLLDEFKELMSKSH